MEMIDGKRPRPWLDMGVAGRSISGTHRGSILASKTPTGQALPLSAVLEAGAPVVELESHRLTEAVSWIYDAIKALRQQSSQLRADLARIDGTLERWAGGGFLEDTLQIGDSVDAAVPDVSGDETQHGWRLSELQQHPESPERPGCRGSEIIPTSPFKRGNLDQRMWRVEKDVRRMVQQQEQKRIAEEKLLEMRMDSLKCELDSRLQPSDLEGVKVHLASKLEHFESRTHEDVGLLGSMLHTENANDRRRMQTQFETLRSNVTSQIELTEKLFQSTTDKANEAVQRLDERLTLLESVQVSSVGESPLDAERLVPDSRQLASLETRLSSLEGLCGQMPPPESLKKCLQVSQGLDERIDSLNQHISNQLSCLKHSSTAGIQGVEGAYALGSSGIEDGRVGGGAQSFGRVRGSHGDGLNADDNDGEPANMWKELFQQRLERLEAGAPSAEVHRQLVDLHLAHTDIHHKLLDVEGRLGQLEDSTFGSSQTFLPSDGVTDKWKGDVTDKLEREERARLSLADELRKAEKSHLDNIESQQRSLFQVGRSVQLLVKFIWGAGSSTESRIGNSDGARGEMDYQDLQDTEALEQRLQRMVLKGSTLEAQLKVLSVGTDEVGARLEGVERTLRNLDVEGLSKVQLALITYKREQTLFNEDLNKEMKELKVLVGCLEACVPQETRKAIALFKRAAGAADGGVVKIPGSHAELQLEGKILSLREEVEAMLSQAQARITDQCEHVSQIVRGLQRRQEVMDAKIDDVCDSSKPGTAQKSGPAIDCTKIGTATAAPLPEVSRSRQSRSRRASAESQLRGAPPGWVQKPT